MEYRVVDEFADGDIEWFVGHMRHDTDFHVGYYVERDGLIMRTNDAILFWPCHKAQATIGRVDWTNRLYAEYDKYQQQLAVKRERAKTVRFFGQYRRLLRRGISV